MDFVLLYKIAQITTTHLDVVKHKGTNPHDHKKWDFCFMTSPVGYTSRH